MFKTTTALVSCVFGLGSVDLVALWIKNPFNQRLMKYLRVYKAPSTTVERALQIHPFLTNKANFQKVKLSVKLYNTADYAKRTPGERGKNKANSKPIQSQFKANSKPIQSQYKPKQSQFRKGATAH